MGKQLFRLAALLPAILAGARAARAGEISTAETFCAVAASAPSIEPFLKRHRAYRSGSGETGEHAREAIAKMKGGVREAGLGLAPLCDELRAFEETQAPAMVQFRRAAAGGFVDCGLLLEEGDARPGNRRAIPAPPLGGAPAVAKAPRQGQGGFSGLSDSPRARGPTNAWNALRRQIGSVQDSYEELLALLETERLGAARIFHGSKGATVHGLLDEETRFYAADGALGDRLGALRAYLAEKNAELAEIRTVSRDLLPKEQKFCNARSRGPRAAPAASAIEAQNAVPDPGSAGTSPKPPSSSGGKRGRK